jgi:serine/threonine protein kinase
VSSVSAVTTAPFLSRPLGNYLLIAQLSEDALGTVFRAIYTPDERRFLRLRVLQSPELSPAAVFTAIEHNAGETAALVHRAIVPNPTVGVSDGVPYLAWDEIGGWTLDDLLERVRALDVRIPAQYALLILERVASALEYAHRATRGRPITHGLVWPGFVSISSNAEIRLGGFGLAEALLNSAHRPRIAREIAPYAAPEALESGEVGRNSDVYSLGVLLWELLTGRRPSLQLPQFALREGESLPGATEDLLRLCLGSPAERFASVVELHCAVQALLTASPYALYSGNLAVFLYKLLNPEGQNLVDASEGEVTNPVEAAGAEEEDEPLEQPGSAPRFPVVLTPPLPAPPPNSSWLGPIVFAVAASAIAAGFFFPSRSGRPASAAAPAAPSQVAEVSGDRTLLPAGPIAAPAPSPASSATSRGGTSVISAASAAASPRKPEARDRRSARARVAAAALARGSAESLRLRSALARIEAERLDARLIARDLYAEAQSTEKEGNRLLRQGAYRDAQPALMRATQLYRMAEQVSREERVRFERLSWAP